MINFFQSIVTYLEILFATIQHYIQNVLNFFRFLGSILSFTLAWCQRLELLPFYIGISFTLVVFVALIKTVLGR